MRLIISPWEYRHLRGVRGDFATGARSTSPLTPAGDFATGLRADPAAERVRGDFRDGPTRQPFRPTRPLRPADPSRPPGPCLTPSRSEDSIKRPRPHRHATASARRTIAQGHHPNRPGLSPERRRKNTLSEARRPPADDSSTEESGARFLGSTHHRGAGAGPLLLRVRIDQGAIHLGVATSERPAVRVQTFLCLRLTAASAQHHTARRRPVDDRCLRGPEPRRCRRRRPTLLLGSGSASAVDAFCRLGRGGAIWLDHRYLGSSGAATSPEAPLRSSTLVRASRSRRQCPLQAEVASR
jgi:hypothetical protein